MLVRPILTKRVCVLLVCSVDYKYSYQYNCADETTGLVAQAVTQCADHWNVEFWWCGVAVQNTGGDFSTTTIDWMGVLEFPRTLATGVTCLFPGDCQDKCQMLRNQGTPSEACTFCYTDCPVNLISTISTLVTAIYHDVYEALKLVVLCFADGVTSCVCATALMLQPQWLRPSDHRYTDKQKCYSGEPLDLLASQVMSIVGNAIKNFGKSVLSDFASIFTGGNARGSSLESQSVDQSVLDHCQFEGIHGAADRCYYERVREICHSDQAYHQFASAHGAYFEELANTPIEVRKATGDLSINPLDLYEDPVALCYGKEEMTLAMVIEACGKHTSLELPCLFSPTHFLMPVSVSVRHSDPHGRWEPAYWSGWLRLQLQKVGRFCVRTAQLRVGPSPCTLRLQCATATASSQLGTCQRSHSRVRPGLLWLPPTQDAFMVSSVGRAL